MPIKYVPYTPEPIEGQALLDNFTRTLRYKGNYDIKGKLVRGMPLYEMQTLETVGDDEKAKRNLVIRGECVSACAYLKEKGILVDLVYIDPPFASGADYAKQIYIRNKNRKKKSVEYKLNNSFGNLAVAEPTQKHDSKKDSADKKFSTFNPIVFEDVQNFEEKMYGDVWDKEKYLNWMYENLCAIKSVMSETASIYVHLDWHIVHYVKVMMDEIFGEDNFLNDITWKRQTSSGFKGKNQMGKNHDNILVYKKGADFIYNTIYLPYSEDYIKQRFSHEEVIDGKKRYFKDAFLGTATTEKTIEELKKENRIYYTENGGMRLKIYLDEAPGIPLDDVWTDIPAVNSQAEERIDYATQKPEALLERIIKASSDENMLIADFFGGSGVTAAVANKLNRHFIHCDVGINSIQTVRDRLIAQKETPASFSVLEIKDGVSLFRNPVQTMEKLKSLVPGLGKIEGFSDFWAGCIESIKDGTVPVYLPDLKNSECKILDKPFLSRVLHEHLGNLPFTPNRVIIYYVDVLDIAEIENFVKQEKSTLAKFEFRDLKQLLDDIVVEDCAEFDLMEVQEELLPEYKITINSFMSDRVMRHIDAYNQKGELNSKGKKFKPITISEEGLELIEWLSVDCTAIDGEWHSDSEIKIDKLGFVIKNGIKTKDFWDGAIKSEKKPLRLKIRNICGDETEWKVE